MDFGARLKELRTRLNYSQKELSEQTGLTLRTIQRIENNEVKPSLYSLKMLGEALKTDLKTLVRNNWKTILWIVLVVLFVSNYDDIKSGILDGWNDAK
jgi:transcriptional regulator with XRE-family HTH domain